MKKLSLYVFVVLMFCNVSFAECIEGDCNNGYGTFTWTDGAKYVGEFKIGLMHGRGTYIWADGTKYVGEFKDGKLIKSKEELMKKYDAYQSIDLEMKMKVAPLGLDFACYNACKERNDEAFCRQKCSMP